MTNIKGAGAILVSQGIKVSFSVPLLRRVKLKCIANVFYYRKLNADEDYITRTNLDLIHIKAEVPVVMTQYLSTW